MKKYGFIGMGNMAQALVGGFLENTPLTADAIYAYAPHFDKLQKNAEKYGITAVKSVTELVQTSDVIFLACKPYHVVSVLDEIALLLKGKVLISIVLGWDYQKYKPYLPEDTRMQFVMPNTPAQVGEGVFLFEEDNSLTEEERKEMSDLFGGIGEVVSLPSNLMGVGGAITGCGPAFVDLMLEGFADAAVKYGINRQLAYKMVSQTVLGSAKLQLETGMHPGELKDAVCSPGGSTIRGVDALEHAGFRAACIDAIDAAMNRK